MSTNEPSPEELFPAHAKIQTKPHTAEASRPGIPSVERKAIGTGLAAFGLLTVILFVIGYWRIYTQFMLYDDEGHFLWTLRAYAASGGLYDRISTLYGPFYFVFYHLLQAGLGLNLDHDTGRLLTLISWCGVVLLCGLFSWRQTRSVVAGLAASVLTFVCLITVIKEPMHPSTLLTPLATLGVVIGGAAMSRSRPVLFAGVAIGIGAAMMLTKINVGAFFIIATGAWLAINSRTVSLARPAALLTGLGCVAAPFLIMQGQWPHPWVTTYTFVFACGAIALTAALHDARQPEHGLRSWGIGVTVAIGFATVIILAASAKGTSWSGLWEGLVAVPKKFSQVNYLPLAWPAGASLLAAFMALLAGAYYYFRSRTAWLYPMLALLRIAAGIWFFTCVPTLFSEPTALQEFCFNYGPSLAWLMAVPLNLRPTAPDRARLWLAWVFIWQTLQAYPVAGSQIGWGSFLWVPLFVVGWHEAMVIWANRLRPAMRPGQSLAAIILAAAAGGALWPIASKGYERFTTNEPIGLPGAARLRLQNDFTSGLRILHQNIRTHASLLTSYPELLSFNVWSGQPLPATSGPSREERDAATASQLAADPKAVVIVNSARLDLNEAQGFALRENVIYNCVTQHFAPAFRVDSYEFWIHRDRKIATFSLARFAAATVPGRLQLQLTVESLPRPVCAMELALLNSAHQVVQRLALDSTQSWQLTPITPANDPAGSSVSGSGPVTISQPARLAVEFTPAPDVLKLKMDDVEIRLRDAAGNVLTSLRLTR